MASISKDPNGRTRIQFVAMDGKRKTIYLGRMSKRDAAAIKYRVERLDTVRKSNLPIDGDTALWVGSLDETFARKLARAGLIEHRGTVPQATLRAFLDSYIASRTDVKTATLTAWGQAQRNLIEYFGESKPLAEISPGDADDWRRALLARGLADSTVCKRCQFAKQFFRAAVRKRILTENPFEDVRGKGQADPTREYFVTRDEAERVIDACPDAQWRLIFALSRFAGLRCPSEHMNLRWEDVNWERNRITVRSPKTEHHADHGIREIPIFSELKLYLEDVFELAEPGDEFVITRYRKKNANLRTQLLRILKRAGIAPWPKLFHNLRATRQTELTYEHPQHVVCRWLGNSQLIAQRHYLQVTDEDFERAAGLDLTAKDTGENHRRKVTHKTTQHTSARGCSESQTDLPAQKKTPVLLGSAARCDLVPQSKVEDRGLEPLTFWLPARRSPN